MLDDAVGAYLDVVTERGFDEPFMALLRAEGFSDIRFTHGQGEFGKDFVAKRNGEQWAFQSKAGDIGQRDWGQMAGQLDELRMSNYAGPNFDHSLQRIPVLVTTGRLVGNAPLLASEYNDRAQQRREPRLLVWDRDELVSRLAGNSDAVLRGTIDGALMALLGAAAAENASMDDVAEFSQRWDRYTSDRLASLGVIEASLACAEFSRTNRLDLACHLALCLVRAAWANGYGVSRGEIIADAAGHIFDLHAQELWKSSGNDLLSKRGVLKQCGLSAWLTYSVMCARITELLSLFAIRRIMNSADEGQVIAEWVATFVYRQPGVGHLIGDRFAVSLVPTLTLLGAYKPRAAQKLIRQTCVWLCDRYETPAAGLAWVGASPAEEADRVLGYPLEHVVIRGRRSQSHAAAITLDLAAVAGFRKLYEDLRNDYLAVGIDLAVLRCPDDPDQYALRGAGNRWELNPDYPDKFPRADLLQIPHHQDDEKARQLLRLARPWDLLAVSASLRDRHFVGAISMLKDQLTQVLA